MQPGPRVYTFFLYLSDVEEGAAQIRRWVHRPATQGKALFWPATKEEEPSFRMIAHITKLCR